MGVKRSEEDRGRGGVRRIEGEEDRGRGRVRT